MKNKRILYVSSELVPYMPPSRRADVSLEIPRLMQEAGSEVRIFMPRHGNINERRHQLHEVIRLSGMNLVVNDIDQPLIIKVASVPRERLQVYFIDNEEYFRGHEREKAQGGVFRDSDERGIFFAKGVLETVKKLNWSLDIVHVNGPLCFMLPLYIKTLYKDDPAFSDTRVVASIFGEGFSGSLGEHLCEKLSFDHIEEPLLADPTYENLTKTCLKYSDAVVVDSPERAKWAEEMAKNRKLPSLIDPEQQPAGYDQYAALYAGILNEE